MLATTDAQPAAKIVEIALFATCRLDWSLGARSLIMSVDRLAQWRATTECALARSGNGGGAGNCIVDLFAKIVHLIAKRFPCATVNN